MGNAGYRKQQKASSRAVGENVRSRATVLQCALIGTFVVLTFHLTLPKIHPTTDDHIPIPRRPPRWYATTLNASAYLLCICSLANESSF